ncbi:hypothetical protein QYF36_009050 [Acer negundo]|nr:hypothetical protein QYF36_009050 [Acer negundo]
MTRRKSVCAHQRTRAARVPTLPRGIIVGRQMIAESDVEIEHKEAHIRFSSRQFNLLSSHKSTPKAQINPKSPTTTRDSVDRRRGRRRRPVVAASLARELKKKKTHGHWSVGVDRIEEEEEEEKEKERLVD